MNNDNLENLLIKDSEFYISKSSYLPTLKRNNIITVKDLLNFDISKLRLRYDNKIQLAIFINMLEYKYLNIQLENLNILNKEIDLNWIKNSSMFTQTLPLIDEEKLTKDKLPDITISPTELFGCNQYISDEIMKEFVIVIKKGKITDNPKVIDFIKWVRNVEYSNKIDKVHPYAKAYIEAYEKTNEYKKNLLKEKLNNLLQKREKLDKEISTLQEEIKNFDNNNKKLKSKKN
jgi:hypothetical protein